MTDKLVFTRYLYNKDEVELTLLECILKRNNFVETCFWMSLIEKLWRTRMIVLFPTNKQINKQPHQNNYVSL